jgi:tRNA uridine 5-carbamoylmethylation protein Kti12
MVLAGITNRGEYLRRMAIAGYVVRVDYSDIRELSRLARNISGNINQIAKRANETQNIYPEDINALHTDHNKLLESVQEIKEKLAGV